MVVMAWFFLFLICDARIFVEGPRWSMFPVFFPLMFPPMPESHCSDWQAIFYVSLEIRGTCLSEYQLLILFARLFVK
jgi:hypothetical protein